MQQGSHVRGEPLRSEFRVLDQQATPGPHHRQRIAPLLAVADRQRHIDRREAHRGDFGAGHGATADNREIGGRIREIHPLDERHRVVAGTGCGCRIAGAVGVQHLHTRREQVVQACGQDVVEPRRALRSAEHEEHRSIGAQAEIDPSGPAHRRSVQFADHPAQRQAELARPPDRSGDRAEHQVGPPGGHPVGEARGRIGLVHDDPQAKGVRGPIGRKRGVAAEAHHRGGPELAQQLTGGARRTAQARADEQQVDRWSARHRHGRHGAKVVAARGDQRGLKTTGAADHGEHRLGHEFADGIGQVQRRFDVARRATRRKHDAGRVGRHHRLRSEAAVDLRRMARLAPGS